MDINKRYNELVSDAFNNMNTTPVTYIPILTNTDYKRGFITRYFVQKTNDDNTPIFEVNNGEYHRVGRSGIYNTTSLRWRIEGSINGVYDLNENLKDIGVKESNKISIRLASNEITKLKLYLPNLLQFNR